ncbi:MAG: DUF4338 domain-containing protein [Desulfobulbus sp.]|nr:DUF4338 domain-containing protein [Desulfobulbus sp.]
METTAPVYKIRGRHLTQHDLVEISQVVTDHWDTGRTAISKILCQRWQWRQPNGQLKDMACRSLLLTLEKKGELTLPPHMQEIYSFPRRANRHTSTIDTTERAGAVSAFGSLTVKMVRQSPDERLWDYLIDRSHYLGSPWIVGSSLKYLAYLDDRLAACLGWGSAAWKVASRNQLIGWNPAQRERNLAKVVNNVRFLILPWVNVRHLASKVLAQNIRQLERDWLAFYREPICLLQTFVETGRFQGTCCRAANWAKVGVTTGRGTYDRHSQRSEPVKAVFLYPLNKNFREQLRG